jgi:hypothetical protein
MENIINAERELIGSFIIATNNNKLKWGKDNAKGFNCFSCTVSGNQKASVDKYYSISNNQTKECFNFTILNDVNEIIIEVVECIETEETYILLRNLYKAVDTQFNEANFSKISPILTEITSSLQK